MAESGLKCIISLEAGAGSGAAVGVQKGVGDWGHGWFGWTVRRPGFESMLCSLESKGK